MTTSASHFSLTRRQLHLRLFFWISGLLLACLQVWSYRYYMTADAISYLDMSDAALPGNTWAKLVNGVWSPLYPFLLGVARRVFHPSPVREVVFVHLVNLAFYLFAFACFEFLLSNLLDERNCDPETNKERLPNWAILTLGYSLFLWASLSQITLQTVRADMLMSGFVYLIFGLVLRLRSRRSYWITYAGLGALVGIGYLAKAAMLPFGMLILASTLLIVSDWRKALTPAVLAGLLALTIGAAYFYPLSKIRGHFTLGEAGDFNYLYHVDRAGPTWYIQNLGAGTGKLLRVPTRIFANPPAYEFSYPLPVTHPLRFEPSYWTQGARKKFRLRSQYGALRENLHLLMEIAESNGGLAVAFVTLLFAAGGLMGLFRLWPLWLGGLVGIGMYAVVHVENRYVGVFFLLLWLGLLCGLRPKTEAANRIIAGLVLGVVLSLFVPMLDAISYDFSKALHQAKDPAVLAGAELRKLGICEGDRVARISPMVTDLMWARVSRASVVAEVDYAYSYQFWASDADVRAQVLNAMARSGSKIVVAHVPGDIIPPPGWKQLGNTPFWFQPLVAGDPFQCKSPDPASAHLVTSP